MQEEYMRRAVQLAQKGIGRVNPNPLVGAVVVKEGRIIGEGYHACYGELHAERKAFASLTEDAAGADLYVTLEPCCHYGKQPPCTQAIIQQGIRNVYVGSDDPNPLVAGKGIRQLREAGIHVETQVLKEECDRLNPVFFHYIATGTPYVVMKYAMSLDGKTACETGNSRWVTGEIARNHVQKVRNALTGIMVGVQTVLQDDPRLTCRMEGGRNPVRIVCDSQLRTPLEAQLVQTAKEIPTVIGTTCKDPRRQEEYRKRHVEILVTEPRNGRVDLRQLMKQLGQQKIDGILLEGGGTLNQSALEAGIVQHVMAYIAPKLFGGYGKYSPVTGQGAASPEEGWLCENGKLLQLGRDILLEYDIQNSSQAFGI